MSKIVVLHLISSSAFLGAERVVCELATGTDHSKFEIHVGLIGCSTQLEQIFKDVFTPFDVTLVSFRSSNKFSLNNIYEISRYLNEHNIDLTHSHGYKSDFYAFVVSKLVTKNVKLIATNHTWKINTISEKIYRFIDIILLKRYDLVVSVSFSIFNEMLAVGIPKEIIKLIYNGITIEGYESCSRVATRELFGYNDSDFVIGCVASLTREKAHRDLITAFSITVSILEHAKLLLVGDGPLREELETLVETFSLQESVIFAGFRDNAKALYQAFDLFTLVSYAEGLPMAMLEAMAASLPIVVSSVGAIPNVVTTMQNGILINPGDIAAISDAFVHIANQPELGASLGRSARIEVVKNYTVTRMAHEYEILYQLIMDKK